MAALPPSSLLKELEELKVTMDMMQTYVITLQDTLNAGQAKVDSLLTVSRSQWAVAGFADVSKDSDIKTVPDSCDSNACVISRPSLKKKYKKSASRVKVVETSGTAIENTLEKSDDITSLANCEKEIVITISNEEAGYLLGSKGKIINLIRRETGARIVLGNRSGQVRDVKVSGATDNVETALDVLNKLITPIGVSGNKNVENVEVLKGSQISIFKQAMVVSKIQYHRLVTKIAPHNSRLINIIGEASGVISQRITSNNMLEIVGEKRTVDVCYKLIESIIAPTATDPHAHDWISKDILQLGDNGSTPRLVKTALPVSKNTAKCITGYKGGTIDAIAREFGVSINSSVVKEGGLIEVIGDKLLVENVMEVVNKFVAPRQSDLGKSEHLLTVGGPNSRRKIVLKAFVLPTKYSASEVRNLIGRIVTNSNTSASIRLTEKVIDTGRVILVSGEEGSVKIAIKHLSRL